MDIMGGKAALTPLILQFIETILGIGRVRIVLGERLDCIGMRGDQYRVFVTLHSLCRLKKGKFLLPPSF